MNTPAMTQVVPQFAAPPYSTAPGPAPEPPQTQWPCNIEITTRISIPRSLAASHNDSQHNGTAADPNSDFLTSTNVSFKFPSDKDLQKELPAPQKPARPAHPARASTPEPVRPTTASTSATATSESVPFPDKTFMIRDSKSGKSITLVNGTPQLHGVLPSDPASHWTCFETGGWLGFRNRSSGMVLGRDGRGGVHARVTHHRAHEWFQARLHPEGGYLLLVRRGEELWRVVVLEDGKVLAESPKGGMRWEFVEVE